MYVLRSAHHIMNNFSFFGFLVLLCFVLQQYHGWLTNHSQQHNNKHSYQTTTNNNNRSRTCPLWLASLHLSFSVPRLVLRYVSLWRASNVELITPCTIVLTSLNDDTYTTHGHSLKKHTDRREQSSPQNRLPFAVGDGSRLCTCHSLLSFYSWFLFDFLQ